MKRYVRTLQVISILAILLMLSGCGWAFPPKITGGEVTIDKQLATDEGHIIITIDPVNSLDSTPDKTKQKQYICPFTGKSNSRIFGD